MIVLSSGMTPFGESLSPHDLLPASQPCRYQRVERLRLGHVAKRALLVMANKGLRQVINTQGKCEIITLLKLKQMIFPRTGAENV